MHVMPNSACCTHACLCADPHVHSQLWELTGSRDDRQLSIVIRIQDTPIAESARFVDCLDIGYPYAHFSCSGARAVTGGEHGGRLTLADRGCSSGRCGAHRQIRDGPARPSPANDPAAHNRDMRRIIGTIVGAIVAVSLAITSVGSIVATLKTFLIIGL